MDDISRSRWRDITIKAGLFIGALVLILLFLPRESENHYTYEVNRPWTYTLLTAPFDIPVRMDSVRAKAVRDSIDRVFEPVYTRNEAIESTMLAEYAKRLTPATAGVDIKAAERTRLLNEISNLYADGIVSREVYAEIRAGRLPSVRFIHDNVAESAPTADFRSERQAYAMLDSLFPDQRMRGILAKTRPYEILQPNVTIDSVETERMLAEVCQRAMAPVGVIQQGERVIDKGDIVTPQLAMVLQTYEEMAAERGTGTVSEHYYPVFGQALYLFLLLGVLYLYLAVFRPAYFANRKMLSFLMLLLVGFTFFSYTLASTFASGLYIVPFTMVPIMTVIFLDSRTALFLHFIQVMVAAVIAVFPLEFIFMQFVAGTVAIDSIKDLSRRSQLIRTAFYVFVAYSLAYLSIEVMQTGSIERLSSRMFGYFGINAVLVSFAYILLFLFERVFGFTSRVTLVELSDINNPLLLKLSEECPGTFQHSMSVSNLASAAASRIGANVQLVRAGALYHDIGKTKNPAFYTENQHGVNPHDALDPLQSARIVISHVTEGLKMAEKAKLPMAIRNFISEHHGRGQARYFHTIYSNLHPDEKVDPAPFTYPGPNPRSRETSILMMADAVEAASRSMTDHSPEAIASLVNRIIDTQVNEGLHNDSLLSFRDVKLIKETFASRLRTMFHSRISYPESKK